MNTIEEFFEEDDSTHPTLNDRQRETLEKEVTIKELEIALKGTKNESSPGTTGFTYPFFKVFWQRLK